ncbi:hypothetical protein WME89_21720 [Sorangium sp. So ce321]|uniref:hypothetical protein n=1 Tax=Sorangium sp. So ce321 TaxID=3133300 RepID=UPI003F6007B6
MNALLGASLKMTAPLNVVTDGPLRRAHGAEDAARRELAGEVLDLHPVARLDMAGDGGAMTGDYG